MLYRTVWKFGIIQITMSKEKRITRRLLFNMINFKQLEMEDKEWIDKRLNEANYRGCDYSFGNLYIWKKATKVQVADVLGALCIISTGIYDNKTIYTYPAGKCAMKPVIQELINDAKERKVDFILRAINKEDADKLKGWFPDKFNIDSVRNEYDYIYEVDKMINLAGKKYHGKRNHIKRFKDAEEWHYEEMNENNIADCIKMSDEWCRQNDCNNSEEYKTEQCAVKAAFKYYKELGFKGGVLYQDNRVVAFSIGEPLNSDTYVVHIEKAYQSIQGAYPMINQQFAEHNMKNFTYVNREDDLGKDGLRKAKMSYYPEILLEKYNAYYTPSP